MPRLAAARTLRGSHARCAVGIRALRWSNDVLWQSRRNDVWKPRQRGASAAGATPVRHPGSDGDPDRRATRGSCSTTRRPTSGRTRAWKACCARSSRSKATTRSSRLEYVRYELGKPRYEPDECRQLRLTYGRPFRVWLRLNKEQPIEEEVYLGDMPIMLGGGEFIINGAERVVVSQLHRSPGVDFVSEMEAGERRLHSCRIIPERGSWIEINVTKKDSLTVRIDQSGKFSVMTLLRAMDPKYGQDADMLRDVLRDHEARRSSTAAASAKIEGKIAVGDVVYPVGSDRAGEIIVESGQKITKNAAETICTSGLKQVEVMDAADDAAACSTRWPTTARPATKRRCCGSISGCGRAIRRSWKRPRPCSTRSSTTRTATGWAASAASASTASSA